MGLLGGMRTYPPAPSLKGRGDAALKGRRELPFFAVGLLAGRHVLVIFRFLLFPSLHTLDPPEGVGEGLGVGPNINSVNIREVRGRNLNTLSREFVGK